MVLLMLINYLIKLIVREKYLNNLKYWLKIVTCNYNSIHICN